MDFEIPTSNWNSALLSFNCLPRNVTTLLNKSLTMLAEINIMLTEIKCGVYRKQLTNLTNCILL